MNMVFGVSYYEKNTAILVIFLFLIMFVLVSLYATNPSKYEFNEYVKENVGKTIRESGVTSNSFINNFLGMLAGKVTENVADIAFTRDNYYLFSIYSIKGVDVDYKFLGIFKQFIPLSNSVNTSQINEKFKDVVTLANRSDGLAEDYYSLSEINIDKPSELMIDIDYESGPAFEIYLFDDVNFNNWQINMAGTDIRQVEYFTDWHLIIDKDTKNSGYIGSGVYYNIYDNTDFGDVSPAFNFLNDICNFRAVVSKK